MTTAKYHSNALSGESKPSSPPPPWLTGPTARTTTSISTSAKQRSWLWTTGSDREKDTPSIYANETTVRWRESEASGSSGFTSVRTWLGLTNSIIKSARQRLFFLHRLQRLIMDSRILCNFYRCTTESILTGCITAWYSSCTALNRKALQSLYILLPFIPAYITVEVVYIFIFV